MSTVDVPRSITYFIQAKDSKHIKIGKSTLERLQQRLQNLQIGHSEDLILLGISLEEEGKLHSKYKNYNIRGEWFKPSIELYKEIEYTIPNEGRPIPTLEKLSRELKELSRESEDELYETVKHLCNLPDELEIKYGRGMLCGHIHNYKRLFIDKMPVSIGCTSLVKFKERFLDIMQYLLKEDEKNSKFIFNAAPIEESKLLLDITVILEGWV